MTTVCAPYRRLEYTCTVEVHPDMIFSDLPRGVAKYKLFGRKRSNKRDRAFTKHHFHATVSAFWSLCMTLLPSFSPIGSFGTRLLSNATIFRSSISDWTHILPKHVMKLKVSVSWIPRLLQDQVFVPMTMLHPVASRRQVIVSRQYCTVHKVIGVFLNFKIPVNDAQAGELPRTRWLQSARIRKNHIRKKKQARWPS